MTTLDLIKHHNLLVRPSFVGSNWRAGKWKGVTGHDMGQAYCEDGTEWEAETLEKAVALCAAGLTAKQVNPAWGGVLLRRAGDKALLDSLGLTNLPKSDRV